MQYWINYCKILYIASGILKLERRIYFEITTLNLNVTFNVNFPKIFQIQYSHSWLVLSILIYGFAYILRHFINLFLWINLREHALFKRSPLPQTLC